jgi:hypothetical protein
MKENSERPGGGRLGRFLLGGNDYSLATSINHRNEIVKICDGEKEL